jgi:hypothetical protein
MPPKLYRLDPPPINQAFPHHLIFSKFACTVLELQTKSGSHPPFEDISTTTDQLTLWRVAIDFFKLLGFDEFTNFSPNDEKGENISCRGSEVSRWPGKCQEIASTSTGRLDNFHVIK